MFSKVFLAQTEREMAEFLPKKLAYMALHFSPYDQGLTNAPKQLPEHSILLLDDSMQVTHHDTGLVIRQLQDLVNRFAPEAILLDFQGEYSESTENMASCILQALPCPVAVTERYAKALHCPVFLSPPPVNKALSDYLSPWREQDIYLELGSEAAQFTVTEKGCSAMSLPNVHNLPLEDTRLHCHYSVTVKDDRAVFTISRTREDLAALATEAYGLGVKAVVGLYQELCRQ